MYLTGSSITVYVHIGHEKNSEVPWQNSSSNHFRLLHFSLFYLEMLALLLLRVAYLHILSEFTYLPSLF